MADDKKKPNKYAVGCLTIILLSVVLTILLFSCDNGKTDPNKQAETELGMLDSHYNEIMTDIGNLNVTGYGDFVNMMNEQIEFATTSINDLNEDYGDESEIINLCKQAWTDLSGIARSAKDGLTNNDPSLINMIPQLQAEYETVIQQIKNIQN